MRRQDSHEGQVGVWEAGKRRGEDGAERRRGEGRDQLRGETGCETAVSPLPVFLFPSELVFYSTQRSSHKRVLTLYNPYTFNLSFKMLCTAPSLYRVVEAEGSIRAKSCVDLVVRHQNPSPRNWGRKDRFRLEVRGGGQAGEREIWAELRGGEEEGGGRGGEEEEEEEWRKKRGGEERRSAQRAVDLPEGLTPLLVPTHTHTQLPVHTAVRSPSQCVVCVVMGVLCVAVLMVPLHSEPSSVVPPCFHVSVTQKLVCAYVLGLLTMVFLR